MENDRVCLSIAEVSRRLGVCRATGYNLAHTGQLPVVRLGRRLLVPVAGLEKLLAGVEHGEADGN